MTHPIPQASATEDPFHREHQEIRPRPKDSNRKETVAGERLPRSDSLATLSFKTAILSRMDVLLVLARPASNASPSNLVDYYLETTRDQCLRKMSAASLHIDAS